MIISRDVPRAGFESGYPYIPAVFTPSLARLLHSMVQLFGGKAVFQHSFSMEYSHLIANTGQSVQKRRTKWTSISTDSSTHLKFYFEGVVIALFSCVHQVCS
eukprot:6463159-Amphidinium_carterae.1